jgi:hypothetical protein
VPQQLKKTTPNFHLVLTAITDDDAFCKTSLSGMLLNYPPPTVVNLYQEFDNDIQRERDTLQGIRHYLHNNKYVQDDDLMLIVDGENSWFQLPSDVMIKQYVRVLEDANARLLVRYGTDKNGHQKFNQSIVFAADKMCEGDDMACNYAPHSFLPANLYGREEGFDIADRPARYLNARMLMGPASDLKVLYQAALRKFDLKQNQRQTMQSVFATIFAEQQLGRDTEEKEHKSTGSRIKDFFRAKKVQPASGQRIYAANSTISNTTQREFSVGLDYTHTLFQPFAYSNENEVVPILHDNSTDLSTYLHPTSWPQYLDLPPSLAESKPPFWRLDLAKNNPSPNAHAAYIDGLAPTPDLDDLPKRKTPWRNVPLLQNTYTGATPAIALADPQADIHPSANVTWHSMWYSPFRRALLRNYFRTPQSPVGYHNSLVGGDRAWDTRGGRGGVWTDSAQAWMPWGEVDGVCGSLAQLKEVFGDERGVWLHEQEDRGTAEMERLEAEAEEERRVAGEREKGEKERKKKEDMKKDKEREKQRKKNEEEQRERKEQEKQKKEKEKKEKEDKEREKQKLETERITKEHEEERERQERVAAEQLAQSLQRRRVQRWVA